MTTATPHGLHHITAISGDPRRTVDFYATTLGLRLVKRTVNFEDPGSWHLYFGDETGSPGSLLTFFPWVGAPRGRAGNGQAVVIGFAVPPESFGAWIHRFVRLGVNHEAPTKRHGEAVLEFLLDHSERFVPSKELNRVVLNGSVGGNAARNQVYELRQRLGAAGAPDAIQYLRGRGYRVRWPVAR